MSQTKKLPRANSCLESVLIANFVRLCIAEGAESESAYKELAIRMEALNELKPNKAIT